MSQPPVENFEVSFNEVAYEPVVLAGESELSEHLTVQNSPVLFGCRTGVCGTCLVEVEAGAENLPPPNAEEKEMLNLLAPFQQRVRLACQLRLSTNLRLRYLGAHGGRA